VQKQGLALCGHNELKNCLNKGNFLETHHMLAEHNPELCKAVNFDSVRKCYHVVSLSPERYC
jgi:endonuclease III